MTDPTVDALARAAQAVYLRDAIIEAVRAQDGVGGVKAFAAYEDFIRAEAVALADAGYVVVRGEDVERLDDALAAIRSYVGDHDIHPAHMPDCLTCVALNGRVAPRLRAAKETA